MSVRYPENGQKSRRRLGASALAQPAETSSPRNSSRSRRGPARTCSDLCSSARSPETVGASDFWWCFARAGKAQEEPALAQEHLFKRSMSFVCMSRLATIFYASSASSSPDGSSLVCAPAEEQKSAEAAQAHNRAAVQFEIWITATATATTATTKAAGGQLARITLRDEAAAIHCAIDASRWRVPEIEREGQRERGRCKCTWQVRR